MLCFVSYYHAVIMKTLFITIFCCLTVVGIRAQHIVVAEPEFSDETLWVTSDSTSVKLPRENASVKTKAGASVYLFGVGKVKSRITLSGVESPLKMPKSSIIRLIVKANDNNTDPNSFINIFKFELKKRERRIQVSETGFFSGTEKNSLANINYQAKKYGTSSYLIMIENLPEGEYGISIGDPNNLTDKNQFKITTFSIVN